MFKSFISSAKTNLQVEILYVAIATVFIGVGCYNGRVFTLNSLMKSYFESSRLSMIADFFAIIIAIYLAVLTLVATSRSGIMPEMLQRNIDKDILAIIIAGMGESFLVTTVSVFISTNNRIGYVILAALVIFAIIGFLNFMRTMVLFFYANTEELARSITEENRQAIKIEDCLEKIERNTRK
ncbi:MAG: hypothetical protein RSC78_02570 [Acidaminococcaceae bacterium]